ncbi:hypothetical protein [Thalassospira xiamenensis]|uniref:hypothetical protein n=1 Tax=Thalassospira xiamenensis TaxID=220697 RepID=UPI003AA8D339
MASETEIANIAMQLIGDQPITSIDEDSDRARLAKAYFRGAMDRALAAHPWRWALMRKVLPAAAEAPAFGYTYKYLIPADCIRVFWVGKEGMELSPSQRWERDNDYIMTDVEAPLQVKFTCRRTSYANMDQYLADVVGAALALAMAQTRKGSDTSVERMQVTYDRFVTIAQAQEQLWQNQSTEPAKSGFEVAMGF